MSPTTIQSQFCAHANYFSSVLAPAVEKRLPSQESYSGMVVDYLTHARPFLKTVSQDLCDDGRMGLGSARSATSFITRSATTAAVSVGTVGLALTGAVFGSPAVALGLGAAGLAVLPWAAEKAVFALGDFAGELLAGVKKDPE
jgi:hypothetical protein